MSWARGLRRSAVRLEMVDTPMMHAQTLDREIFELSLREWVAGVPTEGRGTAFSGGVWELGRSVGWVVAGCALGGEEEWWHGAGARRLCEGVGVAWLGAVDCSCFSHEVVV